MSQLREYIEKHPSETQRLVGVDYAQLIELIKQAENLQTAKTTSSRTKENQINQRWRWSPTKVKPE